MSDSGSPARLLEGLVRLVGKVGSYRDATASLGALVSGLVEDLGWGGAALWRVESGRLESVAEAGDSIPGEFAAGASERPCRELGRCAWPLRVEEAFLGVLAVAGETGGSREALTEMLAGRCAHILGDARQAEAQETLLSGLSHELRAPLQSLLGYLDLLRNGSFGPLTGDQSEALEAVSRNAERILDVTRHVLQVARIDSGNDQAIVGEVVLDELLAVEADHVRPLAAAAGLELRLECPRPLRLISDGAKIGRIVTNLLTNAVKYTEEGSVILRAGRNGERIFIEVADTGVGIAPDRQAAVFEEYVRIDESSEGTGLGLAIATRLARLLDARLTLCSQVGEGTTVRLDLSA